VESRIRFALKMLLLAEINRAEIVPDDARDWSPGSAASRPAFADDDDDDPGPTAAQEAPTTDDHDRKAAVVAEKRSEHCRSQVWNKKERNEICLWMEKSPSSLAQVTASARHCIAAFVSFLAGPDSDCMTGQAPLIDGGLVCN
jgi:hypothetical protein